jgi:phosphoglycolate phosphatase
MRIKNILFDLDGTIINPKVGITDSIRYTLGILGFDRIPEQNDLLWCIGPPLRESFSIMLKTEDKAEIDEAVNVYRSKFNSEGIFQFKLYDGIIDTVKTLKDEGFNIYIATSKPRVMAVRIIGHLSLSGLFDGIYGAELDGTRNRKGELISYLLEKEKISVDEVIMIGDRKHDMIGAGENGILSCGVSYGFGSEEELLNADADYLVNKPEEIIDLIESTKNLI